MKEFVTFHHVGVSFAALTSDRTLPAVAALRPHSGTSRLAPGDPDKVVN